MAGITIRVNKSSLKDLAVKMGCPENALDLIVNFIEEAGEYSEENLFKVTSEEKHFQAWISDELITELFLYGTDTTLLDDARKKFAGTELLEELKMLPEPEPKGERGSEPVDVNPDDFFKNWRPVSPIRKYAKFMPDGPAKEAILANPPAKQERALAW